MVHFSIDMREILYRELAKDGDLEKAACYAKYLNDRNEELTSLIPIQTNNRGNETKKGQN